MNLKKSVRQLEEIVSQFREKRQSQTRTVERTSKILKGGQGSPEVSLPGDLLDGGHAEIGSPEPHFSNFPIDPPLEEQFVLERRISESARPGKSSTPAKAGPTVAQRKPSELETDQVLSEYELTPKGSRSIATNLSSMFRASNRFQGCKIPECRFRITGSSGGNSAPTNTGGPQK